MILLCPDRVRFSSPSTGAAALLTNRWAPLQYSCPHYWIFIFQPKWDSQKNKFALTHQHTSTSLTPRPHRLVFPPAAVYHPPVLVSSRRCSIINMQKQCVIYDCYHRATGQTLLQEHAGHSHRPQPGCGHRDNGFSFGQNSGTMNQRNLRNGGGGDLSTQQSITGRWFTWFT